jgi:hypothetical protein
LALAELDMHDIIDPVEYGKLISTVDNLTKKVDSMDADIKELLQLANQSKGGFWMGMTIASIFGGFLTFVGERLMR